MTLVMIFAGLVLLGGVAVAVRIWTEQQARQAAAARAGELAAQVDELQHALIGAGEHEREWLAVLAHELRSPVGAVLGYAELIGDGAFGAVDPRVGDAVARMARAADQILSLVQGLEDVAHLNDGDAEEPEDVSADSLLRDAAGIFAFDAEARRARIDVEATDLVMHTRPSDLRRAVVLALSAAVKVSAGRTLQLSAGMDESMRAEIVIAGTALRTDVDDPVVQAAGSSLTGAGFRIALARSSLARCGGTLDLRGQADATRIVITVPALHRG